MVKKRINPKNIPEYQKMWDRITSSYVGKPNHHVITIGSIRAGKSFIPSIPPTMKGSQQGAYYQGYPQHIPYNTDSSGSIGGWSGGQQIPSTTPYWGYPTLEPEKKQEPEKPKYTSEQYKGKFCAVVKLTLVDITHTGVLFVRKCGQWKLIEFNGNKIASGSAESFEQNMKSGNLKIEILHMIYDSEAWEPPIEATDLEIEL